MPLLTLILWSLFLTKGGVQMADVSLSACVAPPQCVPASVNYGISRTIVNSRCCSTDRCNAQDVPALNDSSPNGRRCFYCDSEDCVNILHCLGDEVYCVSAELGAKKIPVKGCATRAVCAAGGDGGAVTAALTDGGVLGNVSCCHGNLCNGAGGRRGGEAPAACVRGLALSLLLMFR